MIPIGLTIAGPLTDIYGVTLWFIISGVGTVIISILAFLSPALMSIEEAARIPEVNTSSSSQEIADGEPNAISSDFEEPDI